MRTGNFSALFFLLMTCKAVSQPVSNPLLLHFDKVNYNPAATGIHGKYDLFVTDRTDSYLKYQLVQAGAFFKRMNLGTSAMLENCRSLLESRTNYRINFSYRLNIRKGYCQFGVSPVIRNYIFNTGNLVIRAPEDPLVPAQRLNTWSIHYNAGAVFKHDKLLLQAWAENLGSGKETGFSVFTSYRATPVKAIHCVPAVYYRRVGQVHQAAVSSQVIVKHIFVFGQLGLFSSWAVSGGVTELNIYPRLKLHAGYSFSSRPLGITRTLCHELFFFLSFGKPEQTEKEILENLPLYRSPVYF